MKSPRTRVPNRFSSAFFAVVLLAALAAGQSPAGTTLALVGGRIYPAADAPAIDDGVVLVRSGKIVQVGTRRSVNVPAGTAILDCKGKFITSGFQNSHVHFTETKWDRAADQPASKLTEQLQVMLVRYGFTTVVDTGSLLLNTAALRFRIDSGEVTGPRIFTAGVPLYPPNGIWWGRKHCEAFHRILGRQAKRPANAG